jgi:hypothetical protein
VCLDMTGLLGKEGGGNKAARGDAPAPGLEWAAGPR